MNLISGQTQFDVKNAGLNGLTAQVTVFPAQRREGFIIIKLLLIVVAVATAFCLLSAIASLIAASREMELPDIEDIEIVE